MGVKNLTSLEIDAIGEILNISLGASATAISTMLDARVDITTPVVTVVSKEEFSFEKLEPAVGVEINYVAGLEGKNVMLLKKNDVRIIVNMLMGTDTPPEEISAGRAEYQRDLRGYESDDGSLLNGPVGAFGKKREYFNAPVYRGGKCGCV